MGRRDDSGDVIAGRPLPRREPRLHAQLAFGLIGHGVERCGLDVFAGAEQAHGAAASRCARGRVHDNGPQLRAGHTIDERSDGDVVNAAERRRVSRRRRESKGNDCGDHGNTHGPAATV